MSGSIYVLNGPNLNRLGKREPEIYGTTTLAEIETMCRSADPALARSSFGNRTRSSNWSTGFTRRSTRTRTSMVIDPASLTFTSIPILDALKMFPGPIFELHISNVHRREEIYHHSLMSKVATAVLMGLEQDGYRAAVEAMVRRLRHRRALVDL